MILNILMFVLLYPIMILVCVVMLYSAKPNHGIAFGAAMKQEWLEEEGTKKIIREFNREMKRNLIILAIVPFSCFLTKHISIQLMIWMVWSLAVTVVIMVPYAKANKKVRSLKTEMGWYDQLKKEAYIELKAAGAIRKVHIGEFAAPIFLSAAAALSGYVFIAYFRENLTEARMEAVRNFSSVICCMAVLTLLFYAAAVWMDRQKTDVISTDSDVNVNYARAKKKVWKNFWLAAAWMNAIYVLAAAFAQAADVLSAGVLFWGSVLYSLFALFLLFPLVKSTSSIERAYQAKRDISWENEDDSRWVWGILYHNPKDRHIMVNKRVGIGTTINMATSFGKGMAVVVLLILLYVLLLCIWVILEEFTPISLKISDNCLLAYHLKADYQIPVNEIENLTLIEEHPSWSKLKGTAMENLDKGTFNVHGIGKCEVFLNPQNTIFLQFDAGGTTYYMSGADDKETMELYELLTE